MLTDGPDHPPLLIFQAVLADRTARVDQVHEVEQLGEQRVVLLLLGPGTGRAYLPEEVRRVVFGGCAFFASGSMVLDALQVFVKDR
jgi:hypothetical protein